MILSVLPKHLYIDFDYKLEIDISDDKFVDLVDKCNEFLYGFCRKLRLYLIEIKEWKTIELEFQILNSSDKNFRKISFHVIVHIYSVKEKVAFMIFDNKLQELLWKQFLAYYNSENYSDVEYLKYIDLSVYKQNQLFRTIFSAKFGRDVILRPSKSSGVITYNSLNFVQNSFVTYVGPNGFMNADSLILNLIEDSEVDLKLMFGNQECSKKVVDSTTEFISKLNEIKQRFESFVPVAIPEDVNYHSKIDRGPSLLSSLNESDLGQVSFSNDELLMKSLLDVSDVDFGEDDFKISHYPTVDTSINSSGKVKSISRSGERKKSFYNKSRDLDSKRKLIFDNEILLDDLDEDLDLKDCNFDDFDYNDWKSNEFSTAFIINVVKFVKPSKVKVFNNKTRDVIFRPLMSSEVKLACEQLSKFLRIPFVKNGIYVKTSFDVVTAIRVNNLELTLNTNCTVCPFNNGSRLTNEKSITCHKSNRRYYKIYVDTLYHFKVCCYDEKCQQLSFKSIHKINIDSDIRTILRSFINQI